MNNDKGCCLIVIYRPSGLVMQTIPVADADPTLKAKLRGQAETAVRDMMARGTRLATASEQDQFDSQVCLYVASLLCVYVNRQQDDSVELSPDEVDHIRAAASVVADAFPGTSYIYVEGECTEHPIPVPDRVTPVGDKGVPELNRATLMGVALYRVKDRISAALASELGTRVKEIGFLNYNAGRYVITFAGQPVLGEQLPTGGGKNHDIQMARLADLMRRRPKLN